MAITPVTVTFKLVDFLGFVPDIRRTKVLLDTNVASGFLVDTSTGGSFRITDANVTIDAAGLASFSVLPSGATGLNPSAYQIRVRIDAANPVTRKRETVDLGWYTITAAADLKDLVAAQYVPPTYLSTVTTTLQGYVDQGKTYRDQQTAIAGLTGEDAAIANRVTTPASATDVALRARYAPKWQPNTAYTAGDMVVAPDGSPVKSPTARTSSGSYTTTPAAPPVLAAPTTATTGGTIAAGTTYYYKATALSALGETLASAEVSQVIAAALATPVNAAFTTATTGGTLAAGTYSYRISATNALGQTLASTATTQVIPAALAAPVLNAPTTATTGGTLAAGTYYYKITATNAVGETIGSNEVSQVTTGTTSTVGLTWAAITGATGYKIYRATTTGGQSTSPALVASVGAVTSYTDTGTAVSAGAVPATNTTATTTNTVTVNWGAVTGATGYKVYGRVGGSELLIATVGAVTTYTDTGSVTPAGALPTANTTATNTNTVGLSWAAVAGATGYKIYRATTTGGQSTSPALLATLGAVTTYTDTGSATTAGAVPTTNTANEQAFWQSVNTYAGTQAQTELAATIAPGAGTIFVSDDGFDANDGLVPGKAKATIAAAITALPAGGGEIRLAAGSVLQPTTSTVVDKRVVLTGNGATVRAANTTMAQILQPTSGANGSVITGVRFEGAATTDATDQFAILSHASDPASDITVIGCEFTGVNSTTGLNNGIKCDTGSTNWLIQGNKFERLIGEISGTGYGVLCGAATRIKVIANEFIGAVGQGRHAVYFSAGTSNSIAAFNTTTNFNEAAYVVYATSAQPAGEANTIAQNAAIGCAANGTTDSASIEVVGNALNTVVSLNRVQGSGADGIIVTDSAQGLLNIGTRLIHNSIRNSQRNGIQLVGTQDARVRGNEAVDNGQSGGGGTYSGIRVTSYRSGTGFVQPNDNWLMGNESHGATQRNAIDLVDNAPDPNPVGTVIKGNVVGTGTVGAINLNGLTATSVENTTI